MGTFNKSMLKIWDFLISNKDGASIQHIIGEMHIGRTAAFNALAEMEKQGIVSVEKRGNQSNVVLKHSLRGISLKLAIDSLKYGSLDNNAKMAIGIFLDNLNIKEVKAVLIFGSLLSGKQYNDIDIMLVCSGKPDSMIIDWARRAAEIVSDKPVNVHQSETLATDFKGICVRGFEYLVSMSEQKNPASSQFNEALKWIDSASANMADKHLFAECLDKAALNLAFAFCYMKNIPIGTKDEVLKILRKNYGNLFKAKGMGRMQLVEKAAANIGKGIYR